MLKKAVSLNDGVITNAILVDITSDFDFSGLGYVLADDSVQIGWAKSHDGFRPLDGSFEIDKEAVEYANASASYLKDLNKKTVAKRAGDVALIKAEEDGKSEEEAAKIAQAAYNEAMNND